MEGHWMILGRVLRVAPAQAAHAGDAAQAQVEEHAAAAEAEVAAQAEQAQVGVGVGEAEIPAQAEQAAVEEAEDAAVGEAEVAAQAAAVHEGVEAQHAVVGPQAQLEQRVTEVDIAAAAEAAQAGHGAAGEPDFTISIAPPPRVTFLTAGNSSHPNHEKPDMYPYIIASGPFCLLVRFSTHPFRGTNFNHRPRASHLVVVRHFRRNGKIIVASAERVPRRSRGDPVLSNVESVGFVCNNAGEERRYTIAELRIITGRRYHNALLICFKSSIGRWSKRQLDTPKALRGDRAWEPHGAVALDKTVIWFDLSWGILTCDDLDGKDLRLDFYGLPPGCALDHRLVVESTANIHTRRCIALSENLVRYVEINVPNNVEASATVSVWYRIMVVGKGCQWSPNYTVRFEDIWSHPSYIATELPQNQVPNLVCISPVNSSVVYFALGQRLFGVDVPNHTVVHCENYELVDVPRQPREASGRFIVTWNLDHPEYNIGHVTHEPYVTLPEDISDDEVVQDRRGQSKKTAWGQRQSKSVKITPMKVRR